MEKQALSPLAKLGLGTAFLGSIPASYMVGKHVDPDSIPDAVASRTGRDVSWPGWIGKSILTGGLPYWAYRAGKADRAKVWQAYHSASGSSDLRNPMSYVERRPSQERLIESTLFPEKRSSFWGKALPGLGVAFDAAEGYSSAPEGRKMTTAITTAGGGAAGMAAGSAIGTAAGAALGSVIPVVGTALGGTIGYWAGNILGGLAGASLGKSFGLAGTHGNQGKVQDNEPFQQAGSGMLAPQSTQTTSFMKQGSLAGMFGKGLDYIGKGLGWGAKSLGKNVVGAAGQTAGAAKNLATNPAMLGKTLKNSLIISAVGLPAGIMGFDKLMQGVGRG